MFSTPYKRHRVPGISFNEAAEPSLTKQSFRDETDVNQIMSRFSRGGSLPKGDRPHQYGNFVGLDYREMQNALVYANDMFAELPADMRRRFDNDPGNLVEYLSDPQNEAEAQQLGLLPSPAPENPGKPQETSSPATPPASSTPPPAATPTT